MPHHSLSLPRRPSVLDLAPTETLHVPPHRLHEVEGDFSVYPLQIDVGHPLFVFLNDNVAVVRMDNKVSAVHSPVRIVGDPP